MRLDLTIFADDNGDTNGPFPLLIRRWIYFHRVPTIAQAR
jgi:hypothetical protein